MIKNKPTYYYYIVARDYGFAPNPFYGYCSLACCKSDIRKSAKIGDWILGLGSKGLKYRDNLIYAMKVTEILKFNQYFEDLRFQLKKPIVNGSLKVMHGDNIYYKKNKKWNQLDSHHHHEDLNIRKKNIKMDTKIDRILISDCFYYFGDKRKKLPTDIVEGTKTLARGYRNRKLQEEGENFIKNLEKKYEKNIIYGDPINWATEYFSKKK